MPRKSWMFAPKKATPKSVPAKIKTSLKSQADDLVASTLKPIHVKDDNSGQKFNYLLPLMAIYFYAPPV